MTTYRHSYRPVSASRSNSVRAVDIHSVEAAIGWCGGESGSGKTIQHVPVHGMVTLQSEKGQLTMQEAAWGMKGSSSSTGCCVYGPCCPSASLSLVLPSLPTHALEHTVLDCQLDLPRTGSTSRSTSTDSQHFITPCRRVSVCQAPSRLSLNCRSLAFTLHFNLPPTSAILDPSRRPPNSRTVDIISGHL